MNFETASFQQCPSTKHHQTRTLSSYDLTDDVSSKRLWSSPVVQCTIAWYEINAHAKNK